MELESEVKKWLKRLYTQAESSGPEAKKVKFSDVKQEIEHHCPSSTVSNYMLSRAISEEFPSSQSIKLGKQRQVYVVGVDRLGASSSAAASSDDSSERLRSALNKSDKLQCENTILQQRIEDLQQQNDDLHKELDRLRQREHSLVSTTLLDSQIGGLVSSSLSVFHGPNTVEHFEEFSVDAVVADLQARAPDVVQLFNMLGRTNRHNDGDDLAPLSQLRVMTSLTTLLKCRSIQVAGVQLLLTFMLIARSTSKQAITILNHIGVCTSYTTAWKYLKHLTMEARYLEMIRSRRQIWVYDNLNLQQSIRHEREDCHSSMMNVTSRLAVTIRYLPDFNFSWSDTTPQRSRDSITIEDICPSESDAAILKEHAIQYLMGFLVKMFSSLHDLEEFIPVVNTIHPVQKSDVAPMKLLLKDEKYKSETIDILTQLYEDGDLSGDHQIVVGDQLTCKVIRGSKLWRSPEPDPKNKLTWANEIPGDFHFMWECLKVIFLIFWEPHGNHGSLSSMRDKINRRQVDKSVKVFNVGDEFLVHTFKAHLAARICTHLNLSSTLDNIPHEKSSQWLRSLAETLLKETIMPTASVDPVYCMHRSFLHTAFLYVDLRNSVRYEDGPHIVRLWKLWLPRFIGTGRKNYAAECVHMISKLCADLPRHLSYIATHNRTVNMEGKLGRGKPLDQLIEHYNLVLKQTMRAGGSNVTKTHAEDISLSALFLLNASKKVDCEFNARKSTSHTVRDASKDILKLASVLLEKKITSEDVARSSPTFTDPTFLGHKKISTTTWVKDTLATINDLDEALQMEERDEQLVDIDYELSDVI